MRQLENTLRTSSVKNGKFFVRTKCKSRITPGWQRAAGISTRFDDNVEPKKALVKESAAALSFPVLYCVAVSTLSVLYCVAVRSQFKTPILNFIVLNFSTFAIVQDKKN